MQIRFEPDEDDVRAAVALVRGEYWNTAFDDAVLAGAIRHSAAWVGVRDDGRLVATARAISDWTKRSWVYDVGVAADRRGSGVGTVLMRTLLDHPAIRETEVRLCTRDAMPFYARLGFVEVWTDTRGPYPRTEMVLRPTSGRTRTRAGGC